MTEIIVREVTDDELLAATYSLSMNSYVATPPLPDKTAWLAGMKNLRGVTTMLVFADGQPVARAIGRRLRQQVRGALFPMVGIAGVATDLPARRQGYARQAMAHLLGRMRADGYALTCLYPFRESYYERMGYVAFPQVRQVRFNPSVLAGLLEKTPNGDYEQLLIADGYSIYRDQLRLLRQRIHGMAIYDDDQIIEQSTSWLLLAKENKTITGFMGYCLKGDWFEQFTIEVSRFYYYTAAGRYQLLAWLARYIDQAKQVELWLPAYETPETWWPDLNLSIGMAPIHIPMGRVLDVAKIGGMTTGAGHFTARVSDPLCPWNESIWDFETVDGLLRVEAAKQADCELSIQALSGLVYGTHDPADFVFRGWGDPSPELQAVMRVMFPPKLPHLHEVF